MYTEMAGSGGQNGMSDPLDLEIQMVVSHCVLCSSRLSYLSGSLGNMSYYKQLGTETTLYVYNFMAGYGD